MRLKLLIFTTIITIASTLQGQTTDKGKIGLSYSFGTTSFINDISTKNISHKAKSSSEIGLTYLYNVSKDLELETGVTYSLINIETTFANKPLVDTTQVSIQIINVPLGVRYTFSDYFFINGGALLSFDLNGTSLLNSQSGIGIFGGLGVKYSFNFGGEISVNPQVKIHSLIPFSSQKENNTSILDTGIKLAFTYKI